MKYLSSVQMSLSYLQNVKNLADHIRDTFKKYKCFKDASKNV